MRNALASLAIVSSLALAACAPTVEPVAPTPTDTAADDRASAEALLRDALSAGSLGATDEQLSESIQLTVQTLEAVCADPDSEVTIEAYNLMKGAQSVLAKNGIVPCDVF